MPINPLWSVIIPTYNCASYLKHTLQCVLAQDQGEERMEIIVVDDHSTFDNPEKVVNEFGHGRVKFYQHSENIGKSKNYAFGIEIAKGQYIHLLHGDDTIKPGFYRKMEVLFSSYPTASAAFCKCGFINAQGEPIGQTDTLQLNEGIMNDFIYKIAIWQQLQPPSVVFKRIVYEKLGGYNQQLKYMEDWEFYVRVAVHFQWVYTPEVFANYRIFPENSSSKSILKGKRLNAITQVTKIIDSYLPENVYKNTRKPRKKAETQYLLLFIPTLVKKCDLVGYLKTIIRILIITPRPRYLFRALKITYLSLKSYL